ncbi:MAG TPA: L-threonylcarbamoyladenylate synthase [Candidatus Bipolaricaulota bacterium]|nr:L-threonylcarbamoyladenylate synthase [Candidatus Bipolaricaulota bacterium]
MLMEINKEAPEYRKIKHAAETLKKGGVIVYPTDTIYGLGADAFNKEAIKKIYKIKQKDPNTGLSFIVSDLKDISKYAILSDAAFKIIKMLTPGPYTFILKATKLVPARIMPKRKTIGIRIPNSEISLNIAKMLGNPLISTSINISGEPYFTNPVEIEKKFGDEIDLILDAGIIADEPSTVIDLTEEVPQIIRQGKGDTSKIL